MFICSDIIILSRVCLLRRNRRNRNRKRKHQFHPPHAFFLSVLPPFILLTDVNFCHSQGLLLSSDLAITFHQGRFLRTHRRHFQALRAIKSTLVVLSSLLVMSACFHFSLCVSFFGRLHMTSGLDVKLVIECALSDCPNSSCASLV